MRDEVVMWMLRLLNIVGLIGCAYLVYEWTKKKVRKP